MERGNFRQLFPRKAQRKRRRKTKLVTTQDHNFLSEKKVMHDRPATCANFSRSMSFICSCRFGAIVGEIRREVATASLQRIRDVCRFRFRGESEKRKNNSLYSFCVIQKADRRRRRSSSSVSLNKVAFFFSSRRTWKRKRASSSTPRDRIHRWRWASASDRGI